ncbi:unnamed protein product [Caenorhabditis angaria]|uniref:CHK kinase-like domain-containing protein n=1 Tax=Caenorhabditis angaria TaxID=860376 RepID=A0A9P1IS56_9PELO|nr:unnamed protein product [Caenorhabditis angaria]
MSLHVESSGLLGTHVTWEDIEDEVRLSLATEARFGENKTVTNISDMKGFMSRIALIEPDWTQDSEILPKKFVVKISSQLALVAMSKMMKFGGEDGMEEEKMANFDKIVKLLHNREVETYKLLQRLEVQDFRIPFTKIYAMKKFSDENPLKAYIISEFIEDLSHVSIYENIEIEDLLPIVRSVAAFSAIGENISRDQLDFAGGADLLAQILAEFCDEKLQEQSFATIRAGFPEEYREKVEEMLDVYRIYMNKKTIAKYEKVVEIIGHPPVLTHGDLWSSNLLCTRTSEHRLKFRAIIDWQTVSIGSPGQDVGRLFVSTLSTKNRREQLDFLLETYYLEFVRNLENPTKIPYTLEQLKKNYQLLFPVMTTMVLPGIIPFLELACGIPEEQRAEIRKSALDKMIGMMEDVITTHAQNLIDFPEFFRDLL